jgi:hypothetical protein
MKKHLLLLFSILFFHFSSYAGNEPQSIGARSNALGNASLTLSDAFSLFNNQAAMAFIKDITIGLYTERRFMLKELSFNAGGVILPTKSGVFGLSANYYGFDQYNEKKFGLAYGRRFTEKISGGIQIDYLGTSISEYGNASTFTFEAGLLVKITEQLTTAAHIFNPVRVNSGFTDEKIPTTLKVGLSYEPGKKVLLAIEAKKNIDERVETDAGIEYRVIDALHLRAGVQTNPSAYSFGAGINVKQLKIDLTTSYHPVLGVRRRLLCLMLLQKNHRNKIIRFSCLLTESK